MHATRRPRLPLLGLALVLLPLAACATTPAMTTLVVTATAYNSLPGQTNGQAEIAAWGDRLEPGMKTIAVSPDLHDAGLRRGTVVEIEGLPGEYLVLDRMPSRWDNRIDIYMGEDVRAARQWGVREVRIRFAPPLDD
jgi:3D (Asp-Asp-Asp) domain-containing protein